MREVIPSRAFVVIGRHAAEFHSLEFAKRHAALVGGTVFHAASIRSYVNWDGGCSYSRA